MTVETARYISDLNHQFPKSKDLISEGDDHIRLIKEVVKNTFPGMTAPVTIDADKMNNLDKAIDITSDTVTFNKSVKLGNGKTLNMNSNRIINLAPPAAGTDAVNLDYLKTVGLSTIWPVQSIFMTTDQRNPAEILGIGTWERFAQGRVIIGAGTGVDANTTTESFTLGNTGGEYSHRIVEAELPPHTHTASGTTSSTGSHTHSFPAGGGSDGSGGRRAIAIDIGVNDGYEWSGERIGNKPAVDSSGGHSHTVSITVGNVGGGQRSRIVQPYIVCNIWRRTA